MTMFRLTIGENGTAWGKQVVLYENEAANAVEFLRDVVKTYAPDARYTKACREIRELLKNCWVDAGSNTIPIAVANLVF